MVSLKPAQATEQRAEDYRDQKCSCLSGGKQKRSDQGTHVETELKHVENESRAKWGNTAGH